MEGAIFLDACAGTGAVGIEALSRGARRVVFLERDRRALRLIANNLKVGSWDDRSEILAGEIEEAIERLARRPARFGIVFIDPPYDAPLPIATFAAIAAILSPGGVMVIEHRSSRQPDLPPLESHRTLRTYRYGDTSLTVVRPAGASSGR